MRGRSTRALARSGHAMTPLRGDLGCGPVGDAFRQLGISRFEHAAQYVANLRYGRTKGSTDVLSVLFQRCGTCSSKHALLKVAAEEANLLDVSLALCMFEMSEATTPGVGEVLSGHGLQCIPEAHCYLLSGGARFDFTGLPQGPVAIFDRLLHEEAVSVAEVLANKRTRHRDFVALWARDRGVEPDTVWSVREACIERLEGNAS
jgi:hypothetical protein